MFGTRSFGTCSEHVHSFMRSFRPFVRSWRPVGRGLLPPRTSHGVVCVGRTPQDSRKQIRPTKKKWPKKKIGRTNVGRFFFWSKNWKPPILEMLRIFGGHGQIPRRKLLPVIILFSIYDLWRRGKSGTKCFWSWLSAENYFNLKA